MSKADENKIYESMKIPAATHDDRVNEPLPQAKAARASLPDNTFYEIEYDSNPVPGVGKFVLKSQKIEKPENDPVRQLFYKMREIAITQRSESYYNRFFDRRIQHDNSIIFYKQAVFMKDFEDDFGGNAEFNHYFPFYQIMGYEQLRTYFTWRTKVRQGEIGDIDKSYAFIYIYELLNNIGADNPQDGLHKLLHFWQEFRAHNCSIDAYVSRWLKDYYIFYNLSQSSFKEFVDKYELGEHFPNISDVDSDFDLFCSISKYDIKKSKFYTDENNEMIANCFSFVIEKIRQNFEVAGLDFDDALFRPTRKLVRWRPFKDALFYNHLKQKNRRVILSKNEIYVCKNGKWTFSTYLTSEKGRQFVGFVIKQMEVALRKLTKYKFKLAANVGMIHEQTLAKLVSSGIDIEKTICAAVLEFYRDLTKTVVTVDRTSLAKIRKEALVTQESLIVEEQPLNVLPQANENIFEDLPDVEPIETSDGWQGLKENLSENEIKSLKKIIQKGDIKSFADECGVMLEVLIDGINEKAMDYIGDNLIDDEFNLYEDYYEQAKELMK